MRCTTQRKSDGSGEKPFGEDTALFFRDVRVVNTIIHMLAKFGEMEGAQQIFEQAKHKTAVSYGAMMQGELC